jgi:hypothetical protein
LLVEEDGNELALGIGIGLVFGHHILFLDRLSGISLEFKRNIPLTG